MAVVTENAQYTTRLQKGGALLEDMRVLVRSWEEGGEKEQKNRGILDNVLAKRSRARVADTYRRAFIPRFVRGNPPQAWRIIRPLEDHDLPTEIVRPIYYWITALSEPILYDFVCEELLRKQQTSDRFVRIREATEWIRKRVSSSGGSWSPTVTLKVAQGMLAALRDFGILEGAAKKRIAPVYLPLSSFVYLAFVLHSRGSSGEGLLQHPDWRLFLMTPRSVEQLFLEARQEHLLTYDSAGRIVRIEFPRDTLEGMADVLAARTR